MELFSYVIVDFLKLPAIGHEQAVLPRDPSVKLWNNGSWGGALWYSTSTEAYLTFFTNALFPEKVPRDNCT